jgi:ACR3 family arsenite efflux pump ArsB
MMMMMIIIIIIVRCKKKVVVYSSLKRSDLVYEARQTIALFSVCMTLYAD